jgi:rRNA maturation protein Nop10
VRELTCPECGTAFAVTHPKNMIPETMHSHDINTTPAAET